MFILFPDPWPKSRHHKRRIVNQDLIDALFRTMRPRGELRLATDDPDYQAVILEHLRDHQKFTELDPKLIKTQDWPATRYERKAEKQGRKPVFMRFRRRSHPSEDLQ